MEGQGKEGGTLHLPFLMVTYTEPLLRVASKSVAKAVRKAVGLRTTMLRREVCAGWANALFYDGRLGGWEAVKEIGSAAGRRIKVRPVRK